ncbi:YybH family protein [Aureibaculum conchae]|uniref:YybH family protein n=1 Tax=Aureibaculum sp. 2308TA14-22 TaxID=3108392 RepID=UPI00339AA0D7
MKVSLRLITITLFAILLSCKGKITKDSNYFKTEKELIKSTLIDMWDAIEKGDIDRYASYVHPNFTQFGENDSVLRKGKEAEVKGIEDWIKSSTPIHTGMHEPEVTINGNTAWITYYWSDSGSTYGVPFATKGKSTRIFVKENDKWLCIHGHYTLLSKP